MPYPVSCPARAAAGVRTSLCRLPSSFEAPISPLSSSDVKPAKTGVMYQNASWYLAPPSRASKSHMHAKDASMTSLNAIDYFSQCNQ